MRSIYYTLAIILISISHTSFSLPIDWNGSFGASSKLIKNFRRIKSNTDNSSPIGSQEIPLPSNVNNPDLSFEDYIIKLSPSIIINDSATFRGEITSGYAYTKRAGENDIFAKEPGLSLALYPYNFSDENNNLIINKFYVEYYADTATYTIGRHSLNFGLGAFLNNGNNSWDKHSSIRDGISAKIKLGNFSIIPFVSRLNASNGLTSDFLTKEHGFSLLYDNIQKDIVLALLYQKKKTSDKHQNLNVNIDNNQRTLGGVDIKVTDLYLMKKFNKLAIAIEVPFINGKVSNAFSANSSSNYKANAFLLEAQYKKSDKWSFGLKAGKVDGEDGNSNEFGAMYLHPNYKISNLLFNYNLIAASDPNNKSIYDSYITNTRYFQIYANYNKNKWLWHISLLYAKAEQTAISGSDAYNHTKHKIFSATEDQSDDLGMEVDINVIYKWNKEIKIETLFGYLSTGDYFAFTNNANKNSILNSHSLEIRTSIAF